MRSRKSSVRKLYLLALWSLACEFFHNLVKCLLVTSTCCPFCLTSFRV